MVQSPSDKRIDGIIAKYKGLPGELLGMLEEIQESHPHKYLPAATLEYISQKQAYRFPGYTVLLHSMHFLT